MNEKLHQEAIARKRLIDRGGAHIGGAIINHITGVKRPNPPALQLG